MLAEKIKDEIETRSFEKGKKDGYKYAHNMDYDDFQYALTYQTTNEVLAESFFPQHNPFRDEYFGDYLKEVFEEEEGFEWDEEIPNEYFCKYEDGFFEGINSFWEKIKEKL